MIKLNFVIICENAVIDEKTKNLSLFGIFDSIGTRGFPAIYSKFNIVTHYIGDRSTYEQTIVIKHRESQEEIARLSTHFNIAISGGRARIIGNFLNINFQRGGEYEVEILIDGHVQDLKTNFTVNLI